MTSTLVWYGDRVLGAEFFLPHRIYVENAQDHVYFTYNGGTVFGTDASQTTHPD